jgi:hypothetical protein
MFKLPKKPSPRASTDELADFVEIISWVNGLASAQMIINYLGLVDDIYFGEETSSERFEDMEDNHQLMIEEVFLELENRERILDEAYPFIIDGSVLRLKQETYIEIQCKVYLYLLAATRLNMRDDKVQGAIDGTEEMEFLSAHVLKNYLGKDKSKVLVFGTAEFSDEKNFGVRVNETMQKLKEKPRFKDRGGSGRPIRAKDEGIDVIGWVPFKDNRENKLIVFAQSKTGTSWQKMKNALTPHHFSQRWLNEDFSLMPMYAFCVTEAVQQQLWWEACIGAGIMFDRIRMVEYCSEDANNKIREETITWLNAAKTTITSQLALS